VYTFSGAEKAMVFEKKITQIDKDVLLINLFNRISPKKKPV
jgi:hypothetical protein